ncbi:hypothetical protein DVH24_025682 [Malus domestica]|uniref:Uncharacterized protein n=1 Tax=Malus domestica TaxID=3750 RepID=A0A498KGP1_MALDO|nr:hypothetical protein DVH24_025682 [Malus domestica]
MPIGWPKETNQLAPALRFDDLIADGTAHSRYVKLTKEQAPAEDINPASSISPSKFLRFLTPHTLSLSLSLDRFVVFFVNLTWVCHGNSVANIPFVFLYDLYEISMNVVARTTVHLDSSSSLTGLFCPCVLFGRNVESLRDHTPWNRPCICHAVCIEGGLVRQSLRKKYHLKLAGCLIALLTAELACDPCLRHCCLHWCALCQ